ncbi:MAG: hypothetical protein E7638_03055 [Ruminococcaceae bacterium]|nr:hypothetical protein [Oscillospiraceae bacterium]
MQGKIHWDERPYRGLLGDHSRVSITRLAPGETTLTLEWLDPKNEGEYILEWRAWYTNEDWCRRDVKGYEAEITGLTPYRDYEVRVTRMDGEKGESRYFKPAPVCGTVINYLHPQDERYDFSGRALCSPSLIKLPSGKLLASMDVYKGGGPNNLSLLFKSCDRGETWHYICDLYPLFWGKLFLHGGRLYMIGCSAEFGDMVIGASDDEGETWTAPVHLFAGACTVGGNGYEQSPMPVLTHNGRIYVSAEYAGRELGRLPCMLSAAEDSDLLDPANWHATKPYEADADLLGMPGVRMECLIEGNPFITPDGDLCVMYRVDADGTGLLDGRSVVLKVDTENPDGELTLHKIISMPVGYRSKFMLRYDEVSGYYIAIGNLPTSNERYQQRNIITLLCSKDSENWTVLDPIIDGGREQIFEVGYQYPSFLFDGEDILLQVRTAVNGAHNFHDANYATFHVIPDFRKLLK